MCIVQATYVRLTMTKKKPEDHSSSKAGKDKPGDDAENEESHHVSSRIESEALRAMMRKKKREDNDDVERGDED